MEISQETDESEQLRVDEALVVSAMEADQLAQEEAEQAEEVGNEKLIREYQRERPYKFYNENGDETDSIYKSSYRSERKVINKVPDLVLSDDTDSIYKSSHRSVKK